ncbi:MAG: Gfo/Idh/MocA family oxidoreductase [Anaerolineaceae bacterium]|nr:Gfo/Idh/MocA family oxidoreductase [Anaerolineaceae bacterium]
MEAVKVVIIGAGSRGQTYASYALDHPEKMRVVGVAEPRDYYREKMAVEHHIPAENVYADWKELAARDRFADAVIIATQDAMHVEPAVAFAAKKYDMLLEKPMAPTREGCEQIIEAVKSNDILFGVCHVLRYTAYTRKLKELIDSGAIGEVISIDRVEPVGYWHMAHSFVRGNWRNEAESSFMLLAKSCHDLDWIHYIMGGKATAVSSFGSLKHFRVEEAPEGAAERCLDCPEAVESNCPYSAKKIYLKTCAANGFSGWPIDVLTADLSKEGVMKALEEGPYGRCVYHCDNDVVDHQVVNLEFEGGKTATFSMMAFTRMAQRTTRVFGTRGEIVGDGANLEVYDFLTDETTMYDTTTNLNDGQSGHGGGDFGLISTFIGAVAAQDRSLVLTGADETLASHLMVFSAEQARLEHRMIDLSMGED